MKRILKILVISAIFTISFSSIVFADESVVEYAMKWKDNPNILYQYGGSGRGKSLEECDKDKLKTDCSGFVQSVFSHFGIDVGSDSSSIKKQAKKVFYKQSEAVPGDICWWEGHVGIYIGDNKIIHTNTPTAPNNRIHVTEMKPDGNYPTPSAYLRVVDDVSKLGSVSAVTKTEVQQAKSTGTIVTESDLTGMPIKSMLELEQKRLNLMSRDDLTENDIATLDYISAYIDNGKVSSSTWYGRVCAFLGIVCLMYGVLTFVCIIFDYTNKFVEISLLKIISFGKWKVVSKADIEDGLVKSGYDAYSGVTYLTVGALVVRTSIVIIVGMLLVSGVIGKLIGYIWGLIF